MTFFRNVRRWWSDERGAAGWLIVGILIGIGLVVFGIIKFLIPGD
ncbi:MAG TPA: hypothetical protein VEA19_05325 [Actinomycetota bacterium]|nr:hypothetical protein [Actinomycetota bacterium]